MVVINRPTHSNVLCLTTGKCLYISYSLFPFPCPCSLLLSPSPFLPHFPLCPSFKPFSLSVSTTSPPPLHRRPGVNWPLETNYSVCKLPNLVLRVRGINTLDSNYYMDFVGLHRQFHTSITSLTIFCMSKLNVKLLIKPPKIVRGAFGSMGK